MYFFIILSQLYVLRIIKVYKSLTKQYFIIFCAIEVEKKINLYIDHKMYLLN
jgi:hypothetical protein